MRPFLFYDWSTPRFWRWRAPIAIRRSTDTAGYSSSTLTSPSWIALTTKAALVVAGRPAAAYLARMRCRWVLIVPGAMYRVRATCSLLSLRSHSMRTSISRADNAGRFGPLVIAADVVVVMALTEQDCRDGSLPLANDRLGVYATLPAMKLLHAKALPARIELLHCRHPATPLTNKQKVGNS